MNALIDDFWDGPPPNCIKLATVPNSYATVSFQATITVVIAEKRGWVCRIRFNMLIHVHVLRAKRIWILQVVHRNYASYSRAELKQMMSVGIKNFIKLMGIWTLIYVSISATIETETGNMSRLKSATTAYLMNFFGKSIILISVTLDITQIRMHFFHVGVLKLVHQSALYNWPNLFFELVNIKIIDTASFLFLTWPCSLDIRLMTLHNGNPYYEQIIPFPIASKSNTQ